MSLEPNDPRLTAYALGELEAEDLSTFLAELEASPGARAELDAIVETAELLRQGLAQAPVSGLGEAARARIERTLAEGSKGADPSEPLPEAVPPQEPTKVAKIRPRRRRAWIFAAAALPFALAFGVFSLRSPMRTNEKSKATDMSPSPLSARGRLMADEERREVPAGTAGTLMPEVPNGERGKHTEQYDAVLDNPFVRVGVDPRSTFSIDVDTAAYALVRRFLTNGSRPPRGAVRIEEMINYFSYAYPEPSAGAPFGVTTEVSAAPWASAHRLVRIGLKARSLAMRARPASNLVFLVDVSGSMNDPNKLPLLKQAFSLLVEQLDERDHVSIVVYAGASGMVLPPTSGDRKREILGALERLEAGGSTNGGQGIELAYSAAAQSFAQGGVNRVLLATDGDFNVGTTSQSALIDLIQAKAKAGVFLSVLGFGDGNYNDSMLEKLADKGNGNYAYIDNEGEARKVLVREATGTLVTVAKDVKLQLEFNPRKVEAFRLIGYENRVLAHSDFNDDSKDAGEIGAGHTVTALYELIPAGGLVPGAEVDGLKYQKPAPVAEAATSGELFTVKLRYKLPESDSSKLLEVPVTDQGAALGAASPDFRFAAAVASFGMLLRDSPHKGSATFESARQLAESGLGQGRDLEERRELLTLITRAEGRSRR